MAVVPVRARFFEVKNGTAVLTTNSETYELPVKGFERHPTKNENLVVEYSPRTGELVTIKDKDGKIIYRSSLLNFQPIRA